MTLGIDFGERKLGLALAESTLAEPLEVIARKGAEEKITRLCREQKVEKIIVGVSGGEIETKQRTFGNRLGKVARLPVFFKDEPLTSREAIVRMRGRGRRV